MKRSSFVAMTMGIGGIFAAIGMCMCLLTEWNTFTPGVVMGCIGLMILLATIFVWRKMTGKTRIRFNGRTVGITLFGVVGALLLGVGMCFTMVWSNMILGIIIGLGGIIISFSLIPMIKGLK